MAVPRWLKTLEQDFWSVDAMLFVLAYTVLLLLIPTPSTKWRARENRHRVDRRDKSSR